MRKGDRKRHELRRLIARETEHQTLVARAGVEFIGDLSGFRLERFVDAESDVGRLTVDHVDDRAGVAVEAVLRAVISDLADGLADDFVDIDVRLGGYLTHDRNDTGRGGRLAGDAGHRILLKHSVEDRVGDLVADLVRMTFGHGFGSE